MAKSPTPPPPTTPITVEYEIKLIVDVVRPNTKLDRASTYKNLNIICLNEAPIEIAASITPFGISSNDCSTSLA